MVLRSWCLLFLNGVDAVLKGGRLCQHMELLPAKTDGLYVQFTIEEKVIERAYKKLALDALVIQQGRLAEQKGKHFALFLSLSVSRSLSLCRLSKTEGPLPSNFPPQGFPRCERSFNG